MSEGQIVTGDGCNIAWRMDGPETTSVLLLSNSLGTTMAMWDPQMASFAARFRVLRYDSRGHGQSGVPVGANTLDRLGRDVIELLDALGIEQADFCGLSLGGMIGQWLGTRAPERFGRLVLANTAPYMGPPSGWDNRIGLVRAQGMAPLAAASTERWFTPAFRSSSAIAVDQIKDMLLGINPNGYAGCCAAIRDMDMRSTASLIKLPTLVIGGSHDPATPPAQTDALVAAIAGAKAKFVEAAHLSNVEQPGAFTDACLEFLE